MFKFLDKYRENRTFSYQPRFYDEQKDRLDRKLRIAALKEEQARERMLRRERIKEEYSDYRSVRRGGQKKSFLSSSTTRLLVILVVLIGISYYIFERYLPLLMKFWFPNEL